MLQTKLFEKEAEVKSLTIKANLICEERNSLAATC